MSSIPNRYDRWINRERDKRHIETAFYELDRQSDHLAETTPFGQALRNYVEGIVGHPLRWRMVP